MTSPARSIQPRDRLGAAMRPALLVFVLSILLLEIPGAHERVIAPFSGIETQNLTVQNVRADGPNAHSGIRAGDALVSIDGERLRNLGYFHSHRRSVPWIVVRC